MPGTDPAQDMQTEVEASGPGGFKLRARGHDLFQIAILFLCGYLTFAFVSRQAGAVSEHKEITQAISNMADQQEQANYILTLTPEERVKLRLEMPEGLRKRLRER